MFGSRLEHHIACGGHEPQGLPSDFGGSARRPRSVQLRPLPLPLPGPDRFVEARARAHTHARTRQRPRSLRGWAAAQKVRLACGALVPKEFDFCC